MRFYIFLVVCLFFIFENIHSEVNVHWVDIPSTDYQVILAAKEIEIEHLNELVEYYHSIDKSSLDSQLARIQSLESIADYLNILSLQDKFRETRSTLILLEKLVQCKKEYIKKLLQIPSSEIIEHYHLDFSLPGPDLESIPMRNNRSYSVKMKEYWGEFWLESVDPCHRRLGNYYQFWIDTKPVDTNYKNFFFWLESQYLPNTMTLVNYYSDEQLKNCEIKCVDGYLIKHDSKELVTTPKNKRTIFIMDLMKKIYLETVNEGIWHNSLSLGKPVLCAGLLDIEEGVIKRVAFESGHYLPTLKQGFQFLKILFDQNIRINDPLELIYFENRHKYKIALSTNCLVKYEDFEKRVKELSKRELVSSNEF